MSKACETCRCPMSFAGRLEPGRDRIDDLHWCSRCGTIQIGSRSERPQLFDLARDLAVADSVHSPDCRFVRAVAEVTSLRFVPKS